MQSTSRDAVVATYAIEYDLRSQLVAGLSAGAWVLYCGWLAFEAFMAPVGTSSAVGKVARVLLFAGLAVTWLHALIRPPHRNTRHAVSDSAFSVGKGPLRVRIPLDLIESVMPARARRVERLHSGPMAGEGLRVAARGRRRSAYITPEGREAFLSDLAARCPRLALRATCTLRSPCMASSPYLSLRERGAAVGPRVAEARRRRRRPVSVPRCVRSTWTASRGGSVQDRG